MSNSGWSDLLLRQATTESPVATMEIAAAWAPLLTAGSIVALSGPLGGGKTTFVKGLAEALGASPAAAVSSPTFTYFHMYERGALPLYHFDLYRLHGVDDFLSMGFDEFLEEEAVCCIEWPERMALLLPSEHYHLTFEPLGISERRLTLWRRTRCQPSVGNMPAL